MLGLSRSRPGRTGTALAGLAAISLVLTSACSKPATPEPPPIINDYVSAVQVLGEGATTDVVNQQLGEGAGDGPTATVPTQTTVVNGGSVQEVITSSTPFSKVRIGLEPISVGPSAGPSAAPGTSTGPKKGYHEVTLGKPGTSVEVVLTITQTLPGTQFVFYFAVVDAGGKQGKLAKQDVEAIQVGTGEVQVSVSWDGDSDVDLHVVDPSKEEIYWDNQTSASGGELDLDSNADCELDHKRNENITWTKAPAGEYIVRLDYYKNCDVQKTNYVVTVRVNGQPTRTFSGTFTGSGDQGDEGAGKAITTFKVVATS
jgi:hypothetical protein